MLRAELREDLQGRSQERRGTAKLRLAKTSNGEAKSCRGMAKLNKARCDLKLHLAKEREITMVDNVFGSRLKELRKQSGIKKCQCQRKIGYSGDTFWRWETGERIPNGKALIDLATFFNVSVDYLLGLTDREERLM